MFGWATSTADNSSALPSLADARNLVQVSFWELSEEEARIVVWQANANRYGGLAGLRGLALGFM